MNGTKASEKGSVLKDFLALRPASEIEGGLFYSKLKPDKDAELATVGHLRMDFGHSGKEFWHTWWPHNGDRFNTDEFKDELQMIVDMLRRNGLLQDLASMHAYCARNGGVITKDGRSFGYVVIPSITATACAAIRLRAIITATVRPMI